MRYPASEKLEIIQLVEQSPLPVRHTLAKLGIPRATFYRWYDRHSRGGPEALNDRSPRPDRVWNRIPDGVRESLIQLALDEPVLSPREFAVRFSDSQSYFVSGYAETAAAAAISAGGLSSLNVPDVVHSEHFRVVTPICVRLASLRRTVPVVARRPAPSSPSPSQDCAQSALAVS